MGRDRRRSPRIRASLELQIAGIERRARIREGDLSLTGLFVQVDAGVGEPGAVHALRLRSRDRAIRVEVPGRVVRVDKVDDLLSGTRVSGVAFEFLCYEPGKREELNALVLHVLRERDRTADEDVDVDVASMSLETGWQLRKGERVRIEVPSPTGGTVRFEGRAVRSRRKPSGAFRTQVESVGEAPMDSGPITVAGIRDSLRAPAEAPDSAPSPVHLSGDLAFIPLPGVLSIIALERFTGELRVRHGLDRASVFVREGQVVDCDGPSPGETEPQASLAQLFGWREGRFELSIGPCEREDRIRSSTAALLLDLARAEDEKKAKRVA